MMARARTKSELLSYGQREFNTLMTLAKTIKDAALESKPVFDNRTFKDVLAHLFCWQELMAKWYEDGMKGITPVIPAPGYTFKTAPALNEALYQQCKNLSWQEVSEKLIKLHNKMIEIIKSHTEIELEEKKHYKWTGSTSLACYFASAVSSHYVWAIELGKRIIKTVQ